MSFWKDLPKPFFAMAPMKDVTDVAFRALVAKRGAPDIFWTEFVSADGLYHTIQQTGATRKSSAQAARPIQHDFLVAPACSEANPLLRDLQFTRMQRPIVAQIFSSTPEMIAYATKVVAELGFDGVDINMGCPDKKIEKQSAGASLIKNPKLAVEIIRAAQEASSLPVSVKTRVGYNKESLDEWLPVLLEANPVAITLHLRTRKEMSLVPAHWELMKRAAEMRDKINPNVLLIGNGDVQSIEHGKQLIAESAPTPVVGAPTESVGGCDGAMIGRAMFGNPWIFSNRSYDSISQQEKLDALVELAHEFEKITPQKHFAILKKHIKAFVTGFDGAVAMRAKLMEAENAADLERIAQASA